MINCSAKTGPSFALIVGLLTAGYEGLRAQVPNYCALSCDDCWIIWDAARGKFTWQADVWCSAGMMNECKYGLVVNLFDADDPDHAWWSTGTTAWMTCNTTRLVYSSNLAMPPGAVRGHEYIALFRVNDAFLGLELCEDVVTFTY